MRKRTAPPVREQSGNDKQLAVFNQAFESFNKTIRTLNQSYAELQSRHLKLADELTATNERLREALEENVRTRNFLENVLDSLTSGVLTIDLDGTVTGINRAGCAIFSVSPEQIIGKNYVTLFGMSLSRSHSLYDLLRGGESYSHVEKYIIMNGAGTIPIAVSSALITDSQGEAVGALEVFDDLSDIKRMEDEVARVKSLAALGEMAAVVAHEVRNPLSGIGGFAALLAKELGDRHPQRSYVSKILTGVENLNRSVTSLLEYAGDLKLDLADGELDHCLRETVEFFRLDLQNRQSLCRVELALRDSPIRCRFDRENMSRALLNLLQNAEQAMPDGGLIRVSLYEEAKSLKLKVSDHGKNVPEDIRDRIFTPFFSTREGGTGLGLALVKKIVEAHRGTIKLEDHDGCGATFSITLHSAPGNQAQPALKEKLA